MPTMLNSPTEEDVNHAVLENQAQSLGHLFRDRVNKTPDAIAYWYPEGEGYAKVTWRQAADRVYALAAGLVALGVGEEDRVAIAAGTSYDWVLADLANMCSGAATTTIYPTTIADDVAFIISDSGSKVIFAENAEQLEKLRSIRDVIPEVSKVVLFEGDGDGDWVMSMEDLEILGRQQLERDPETVSVRIENITPDRLATIIYTSGTTGRPKGVRLLHRAWAYEGAAVDSIRILGPDDLQYLWLPLAHVFGKVLLTLPIQIGFPTAIDGRIDKIVDNLAIVKPTFMGAAPRIFEKAYGRIQMMMEKEGGAKLKLFNWAGNVGRQVSVLKEEGKSPNAVLALQHRLADKIIMTKIRDRFGGNIRFFISGSAALNRDVARWFDAMGLQISEGYGMTESSAATTVNPCPTTRRAS